MKYLALIFALFATPVYAQSKYTPILLASTLETAVEWNGISVTGKNGKQIFTLYGDGRLEKGPAFTNNDKASIEFLNDLTEIYPAWKKCDETKIHPTHDWNLLTITEGGTVSLIHGLTEKKAKELEKTLLKKLHEGFNDVNSGDIVRTEAFK